MNDDNVVEFSPSARSGMARRGAPDKGSRPAEAIELECPSCSSRLRLRPEWLPGETAVLCGRCDTEVALVSVPLEMGTG